MLNFHASRQLVVYVILAVFFNLFTGTMTATAWAAEAPAVMINEFVVNPSDSQWIELINTTEADIDLSGWHIASLVNRDLDDFTPDEVAGVSGVIPAHGLITVPSVNLNTEWADIITLYDSSGNIIDTVTYGFGSDDYDNTPSLGSSAANIGGLWYEQTPSKGWFNDAGMPGAAPDIHELASNTLATISIITNLGYMDDLSAASGLFFHALNVVDLDFDGTVNLTDQASVNTIAGLLSNLELIDGKVRFSPDDGSPLKDLPARITFYNMADLGYFDQDSVINGLVVRDDNGVMMLTSDPNYPVSNIFYSADTDSASFEVSHFTSFNMKDTSIPAVYIINGISLYSSNSSPSLVFSSTEAGTVAYEGGCLGDLTAATADSDNFTNFVNLPDGLYESCKILVTDESGNVGSTTIPSFTIDTTAPVITINGDKLVEVIMNTPFNDPGAIALDNIEGDISSRIATSSPMDLTTTGEHLYYYDVMDSAENEATTATRTVRVISADGPVPTIITDTPAVTNKKEAHFDIGGEMVELYKFKLDQGEYGDAFSISDPINLSGLAKGSHSLSVKGKGVFTSWTPEPVVFTWVVQEDGSGGSMGGGGSSVPKGNQPPRRPEGGFSVIINNGSSTTEFSQVDLSLNGGYDAVTMTVSNNIDFFGADIVPYQKDFKWSLLPGAGSRIVYVKFYNLNNIESEIVTDRITVVEKRVESPMKKEVKKVLGQKIYADNTLIRGKDRKIYIIIKGKKVHIKSFKELWRYRGRPIIKVTNEELGQY